ncbi:hypothetical protein IAE22_29825, partial [Bacillus sp. S34]|nr:hypothetical protein [Bacillus sp. S34]
LRALLARGGDDLEVVAVNDLTAPDTLAHLFRYDSALGPFAGTVEVDGDTLVIDGRRVRVLASREPAELPWDELGVEVVLESTGRFTARDAAAGHLTAGARRVLISAPATGADATIAYGVNTDVFDPAHPLLDRIRNHPDLQDTLVIAEPWDVGPDGWKTGSFGPRTSEWNDGFRNTVRQFWLTDIAEERRNG